MSKQLDLFDGFLRLRNCRKCDRKLHHDQKNQYRTREAGLCYACLREFEASPHWTIEQFLFHDWDEVKEFYEAADQLEELF